MQVLFSCGTGSSSVIISRIRLPYESSSRATQRANTNSFLMKERVHLLEERGCVILGVKVLDMYASPRGAEFGLLLAPCHSLCSCYHASTE